MTVFHSKIRHSKKNTLYHREQDVEMPDQVEKTIFNDLTIDGHFQCALPLQCLRRGSALVVSRVQMWNKMWTLILPCCLSFYRICFKNFKILPVDSGAYTRLERRKSIKSPIECLERNFFARMVLKLTNIYMILWMPYHVNQLLWFADKKKYHHIVDYSAFLKLF